VRDVPDGEFAGYEIFLLVGAMVATVSVEGPPDMPLDLVAGIASAQADCLEAGECTDAYPIPEAFLASQDATPVAATPTA